MNFRNALLTDIEDIRQISEEVFGEKYYSNENIKKDITNNIMVVCVKDTSVIGFNSAMEVSSEQLTQEKPIDSVPLTGSVGYLKTIGVKEEFHGKGIGSELLSICMDQLSSDQYFVEAWRRPDESKARIEYLLEKYGFERCKIILEYWADQGSFECLGCQRRPCKCTAGIYIR